MIIRITQKLSKKIKVSPAESLPLDPNPFADWSANLFTADRSQYILLTNTASLYSILMPGRGISNDGIFLDRASETIREFLVEDGFEEAFKRWIATAGGGVQFSKALNRSVTGSMNDLIYLSKVRMIEQGMSLHDASVEANDTPMSAIEFTFPREEFLKMIESASD